MERCYLLPFKSNYPLSSIAIRSTLDHTIQDIIPIVLHSLISVFYFSGMTGESHHKYEVKSILLEMTHNSDTAFMCHRGDFPTLYYNSMFVLSRLNSRETQRNVDTFCCHIIHIYVYRVLYAQRRIGGILTRCMNFATCYVHIMFM